MAWLVVLALVVLVAGVAWWARRPTVGSSRPDDELAERFRRSGGWV